MCINTVSLPNVSQYGDISIYCCISSAMFTEIENNFTSALKPSN